MRFAPTSIPVESPRRPAWLGGGLRLLLLCAVGLSMSLPFLWMIGASFKRRSEVESASLVPQRPTPHNYPVVLNLEPDPTLGQKLGLNFGRWYFNSLFTAFAITLLQVLTSAMAGYAFARMQWAWRDRVFLLYLATLMIPGLVIMIPNFQIMVSLGFLNSYHGLIIPAAFSAFGTFLLRQFMLSVPRSLDEAAFIDGASHWQVFWQLVMPLARPGMIALAIITFLSSYQSFFWPLIMLNNTELYPMSVGMLSFDTIYGRQTELIMAATVMNIVPLIVIFVMFQKFLVKGLQLGAVKG
jgi:ABC-type glycerol-3-phosphate transport system permease component